MKAKVETIDPLDLSSDIEQSLDSEPLRSGIDVPTRVRAIIVDKLGVDENEVTYEASFVNDLGADDLDTIELIMQFEKEYGISIPDDQAENMYTVGDVIAFIEQNAK